VKKSQLQQIIREEVRSLIRENQDVKDQPLTGLATGRYEINWTNDNKSGWDTGMFDFTQQIKSQALQDGDTPYWFWKSVVSDMDNSFTRGDKIVSVIRK